MSITKKVSLFNIFFILIIISFVFSASALKIPSDHPRVYIRPHHISELKKKVNDSKFKSVWNYIKKSNHPLCLAYKYIIYKNKDTGRKAIKDGLAKLKKCKDGRREHRASHYAACIYDWCYPLMTSNEKNAYIKEFKRLAASHRPGYPANPNNGYFVASHDVEGWVHTGQLPQSVAIYNENKTMYEAVEKVLLKKIIPTSNFYSKAHMHHQGDAYGSHRFLYEVFATLLYYKLGYTDVFSTNQKLVPYQFLYNLRPDLQQIRSGDSGDPKGNSEVKSTLFFMTGGLYRDPTLLSMEKFKSHFGVKLWNNSDWSAMETVFYMIAVPLNMTPRGSIDLPKSKYFPSPMGEIVARTGWNLSKTGDDAVVHMRIGEYFFYNHQRKDFGIFQIYYKGTLTMTSGGYKGYESNHFLNYAHQTVSQNGLLIHDPKEKQKWQNKFTLSNDGGQLYPYSKSPKNVNDVKKNRMGLVLARKIGFNNKKSVYNYISGDITKAYSSKVKKVTRSMVTFNTGNSKFPIIFIVFDRVTSSNKNFKKTWLMHTLDKPTFSGTRMTVVNNRLFYSGSGNYRGKLIADCLLPKKPVIKRIGGPGKEFWVEGSGKNYSVSVSKTPYWETGAWRFEVSPKYAAKEDYFLHAMTVMDKNTILDIKSERVEYDGMLGAHFLGKTSLFSKTGKLIDEVNVTCNKEQDILLCDLEPGQWTVKKKNDRRDMEYTVSDTGKCLYLKNCYGNYRIRLNKYGTDLSNYQNDLGQFEIRIGSIYHNAGKDNIMLTYSIPAGLTMQKNIRIKVELFNTKGKRFASIVPDKLVEGVNHLSIYGNLNNNTTLPVGSYFLKLQIGSKTFVRKFIFVK